MTRRLSCQNPGLLRGTHWSRGILGVLNPLQLLIHVIDINQVDGVGALQKAIVLLSDELIVLWERGAVAGQAEFVQKQAFPSLQHVAQSHTKLSFFLE